MKLDSRKDLEKDPQYQNRLKAVQLKADQGDLVEVLRLSTSLIRNSLPWLGSLGACSQPPEREETYMKLLIQIESATSWVESVTSEIERVTIEKNRVNNYDESRSPG